MTYPDYFDDNPTYEKIINLHRQLEDFILYKIADVLLKNSSMTATADRLIWRLQQMGESREEIERKLQEITKLSRTELRKLLQDAVLTSWADEKPFYDSLDVPVSDPLENAEVIRIMDAQYKKSLGELSNLTRTTMEQSQKDLINMLSEYDMRIAAGVQSPTAAVCEILDRYAGQGIMVKYPTVNKRTGKQTERSLEAAVRLCITTSTMQMTGQVTAQYIAENDVGYFMTSAHLGARVQHKGQPPLAGHDNWQGKIFKIVGSEPGFPNLLENTGYTIEITTDPITGAKKGVGKVIDLLGLYGYGCKHSGKPCSKDSKNPWRDKDGNLILGGEKVDSETNRKRYEISQKARAMERAIRETKRQLLMKQKEIDGVAETDVKDILQPEYDRLAYKLRTQNKRYNEFCEANGLKKEVDRTKKSGFGRKQAAKANGAATRYANNHENNATEMFRKGNTHRKVENGIEIIDQPTYNKLIEPVLKNGGKVYRGTDEIENHLKMNDASASTIGDVILFRKNVTVSDVLEETFHFKQNLQKRNADKPFKEQVILNEIEAKEYVLSCQKKYHISESEVEQTKNQLESYKKELEEYYESDK